MPGSKHTLYSLPLRFERDVVRARQRAREIARILGFDAQDQIRIATGTSEIARNAFRYAREGEVQFIFNATSPQSLLINVTDKGPGIPHLDDVLAGIYRSETGMGVGIFGTKRLMDSFDIQSSKEGTTVSFGRRLPKQAPVLGRAELARLQKQTEEIRPSDPFEEIEVQNQELLKTLAELRARQEDLVLLNRELEDTNRGVVALYAELDERADYLRRASELKTSFLSNMSHEFRTPLNSIISLARILQQQPDMPLSTEQERQVQYILRSATDLSEMVNDLLEIARVEAGKVKIRPKRFEVAELFGALRGMLRPLLVDNSLDLVFEEPEGIPTLYTDEGKVSQILRNFISNALKFTPQGEVRVSARLDGESMVVFVVKDTGIGIAEEDIPIIFKEFGQVESALQQRLRGTGLGLPLCRNLAELLGGHVSVESEVGAGSTFYAHIPVAYAGLSAAGETRPSMTLDPARLPVLMIEDNKETAFLYESYLRGTEFQPISVTTLEEARAVLQTVHPAVVVLDIFLEAENTYEFLKGFVAGSNACPVIVISVNNDGRRPLSLGASVFLPKPADPNQLLAELRRLTGHARTRKILLVDDNEVSRYVLREHLPVGTFDVLEARDGREGLRLAHTESPDLVFLDLLMPDMSGYEVLAQLRADKKTQSMPVIVYTSKALDEDELDELLKSVSAVVPKSVIGGSRAAEELKRAIERAGVRLSAKTVAS